VPFDDAVKQRQFTKQKQRHGSMASQGEALMDSSFLTRGY
jgi:hypothetical protein